MAVIRLGTPAPVLPARRIRLDAPGMLALQRAGEVSLPDDVRIDVNAVEARLAGVDLDALVDEATARLREHGVLGSDGRPVETVAGNLQGMLSAPRRVRTTYAGPGRAVVGYHWTGAELAGSLVRDGDHAELSLFDARSLGDEIIRMLPEAEESDEERTTLVVPIDELAAVAAIEDDVTDKHTGPLADFLGLDVGLLGALRSWVDGFRGVLHCTVVDTDPDRLPHALVWFDERSGWWSARTRTGDDGTRSAVLEPRRRDELAADLGVLIAEAWT